MLRGYTRKEYMNLIGNAIERTVGKNCLIIFFGSIVDERFSKISDIDVAVFCKKKLSAVDILRIRDAVDKLPILRDVDIVDLNSVKNVELIEDILEKGMIWKNIPELLKDLKNHLKNLKRS